MSGICGFFRPNQNANAADLRAMAAPLKSGRTTTETTTTGSDVGVAAVPLPAQGESGRVSEHYITYVGRIRWKTPKYQALAISQGTLACISKCYIDLGSGFLNEIEGPLAIALIEPTKKKALLAIDRIGIQGLAFSIADGTLVFGSSADSIVAHPAIKAEFDPQSIFDYLWFHMVPSPRTIYRGIEKLLPGQYLLFENGKVSKDFYWRLAYQDESNATANDLATQCTTVLRDAMKRHATNSHIGAFLSGGLDSSTTSGLLTEYLGRGADTFSIGFDAEGYDEMEYARISARHFATHQHEYYVTPKDVADAIPLIAQAYDEPFGNASAVPTYFCAKMAKENGVDIMIAGDGGDEIFAGNERYAKQQVFEKYFHIPGALRKGFIEPLALNIPGLSSVPVIRKAKSYIEQARIPLPDRLETYNFLKRTPLHEIFEPEFLRQINLDEPLSISRDAYHRTQSRSSINRMMHLDLKNTLADNDLRKVNRMCELAGVEVRYPLLDEKVVEFAASVPPGIQMKDGKLRYFYKYAMRDFLHNDTLTKQKHGFGLPFGLWMREDKRLHSIGRDSVLSFSNRGIIKRSFADSLLSKQLGEHASYYGVLIWVITMLESWLQ